MPNEHFSKFAYNWCCQRALRTCRRCCNRYAQLLLKMRMSSRYTTTKDMVKGRKISSINLMKVVGALVKQKFMTNHSKRPSLDLKEIFLTSICSIGTWWYPDFRSILLKNLAPLSCSRRSSIWGIGYPISNCDFVKGSIINTESPCPIFLFHQHD